MWREDGLYDALVVIGYNLDPVVPGAGSAIFLHIAAPDFAPTAGCVAVEKGVLLGLAAAAGTRQQDHDRSTRAASSLRAPPAW